MADLFWKSMPAALKRPTLDELYKRLRDLNYKQVDERIMVRDNFHSPPDRQRGSRPNPRAGRRP